MSAAHPLVVDRVSPLADEAGAGAFKSLVFGDSSFCSHNNLSMREKMNYISPWVFWHVLIIPLPIS